MKTSIRNRLLVAFICLAIVPLLLIGGIIGIQSYSTLKDTTIQLQGEMGQSVLNKITAFFDEMENELTLSGKLNMLLNEYKAVHYDTMKLLMSKDIYDKLLLLNRDGRTIIYLSRLGLSSEDKVDYSNEHVFIKTMETGTIHYSPVRFEDISGEPLISIAIPLVDLRSGKLEGVLLAEVRLKKIWNLISDVQVNPGQSVYIVDAKGKLIAHRNPSLVLKGLQFAAPAQDGIHKGLTGENSVIVVKRAVFGGEEFNIVAEQTASDAFALAINFIRVTAALIVLALLAAGVLGLLIVKQVIRPIHNMAITAMAISTGDLSQQVDVKRNDELGLLGSAFNSMSVQLKSLIDSLEQKIEERTAQLNDAQAELIRQERLAALGKLTATIAHEIRNPLATVNTSIFSIGAALEKNETERIKRALGLAERNVRRCDNIITELLDYTRKLEIRPSKIDIDRWVGKILDEQTFPEGIICRRNLSCGLEVRIDGEHMRRAVINIVTNAVHALSEELPHGKELTVETGRSGENLEIRVIDKGPGIPDDIQHKIFEPLFSTKGFGVGLGLSITKDIMEKHHGGINLTSKVGEGTMITLWVPIDEQ
ncbi:MAG: HAMP domain-containing protein [Deltaproteobacteria bacterium]|nr:HAMP domain-containing protein [Deltaproteobacteria bacterium]